MSLRRLLPALLFVAMATLPAVHAQTTCTGDFCSSAAGGTVNTVPTVNGSLSVAAGSQAQTTSSEAVAIGAESVAGNGQTQDANGNPFGEQTAIGFQAQAIGQGASAVGGNAQAQGNQSSAFGASATAIGNFTSAFGAGANAVGAYGSAFGISAQAIGQYSLAAGNNAQAQADYSTSLGTASYVLSGATGSMALGFAASAQASDCTAIGNGAVCNQSATVSFGSPGQDYTLQHVAPGVLMNDAVNVGQLNTGLSYLGGGAGINNGVFTAPSYVLSGGTFNNVGSALLYLDNKPSGGGSSGSGATVTAGTNIVVTKDANGNQVVSTSTTPTFSTVTTSNATSTTVTSGDGVTITPATGNAVTLSGGGLDNGGNVINGVGNGQIAPGSQQAINGGQLFNAQAQDRNWAKEYTDQAVSGLNDRIARVGAESAAEANLGPNYRDTPNSFAAGLGFQGGHNAIAVGYRHISESQRVSWTIQAAISGPERSVGMGIGYGW
jgi:hypothetical protein